MDASRKKELLAQTDKFVKEWKAKGYPQLTDEEVDNFYLDPDLCKQLGPTVAYRSVKLPLEDALNMSYITVDRILNETDMEVRRVLISFMGVEKFLKEGGAVPITEEDSRGYQIVKIPITVATEDDEIEDKSWYFLKMTNSTIEPKDKESVTRQGVVGGAVNKDGYKIYFLRLPLYVAEKENLTNEAAVAWSFGMHPRPGAIYNNKTNTYLDKSQLPSYEFNKDKREFTTQGRQGDVLIKLLATSLSNLEMGKLYTKNGYDPELYDPEVES
ncbi:hypothetical protein UFOVP1_28 [uncultured Caudovirales phage]|uniref:DUF6745 domain-containing protein n=1 Tax=uncultured Caudovirales phage TaxID=2100421 RepID=A0A6J5KJ84_9CAUD|nr:hypothetical protein UFOVP1_28 [uncultured Caudovirales phage]